MLNKTILVKIKKVTFGADGKVYIAVDYPLAENRPTFVFTKSDFETLNDKVNLQIKP
jgi:propanediol dehydratase small subunit